MIRSLSSWILAIRPRTLPASIAPVMIATALAFEDGVGHFPSALIALGVALLLQIATNLANDYGDFLKGADTPERLGPVRVTQAGLVSPEVIKWAAVFAFFAVALLACPLISRAGLPALIIAVTAIISGILYTAGPWPLAYLGLGEIFVLIFFGPVAVAGTYFVQSYEWNPAVLVAGLGPGFLSVAILAVNNLRDIESDTKANKRTLAVRLGRSFARCEYLFFILAAAAVPVAVHFITETKYLILLTSLVVFLAIPLVHEVMTTTDGPRLNKVLSKTGLLLFIYALVFSLAWII